MSATPLARHAVHFEDISASDFGTPLSAAAPTSVDYLNAQLVAHGFAHGNGLNLSELRGKDQQVVLKCLANMLGQRLDDMGRSEQLSAKYKTLSYDHERLIEQHRAAREAAAQAEREMETGKAKVESAQKRLLVEEEAHRKAREDFQRLKMAMQYLRTTATGDIKRKEKEIEKMTDRWGKIANEQVRLGAIGSGLACANLLPEGASSEENNIWEAALADSEAARLRLLKENDAFRDVILACANALQTLHYTTVSKTTQVETDEPELILSDTLFISNPAGTQAETAQEKLRSLFGNLREALSKANSSGSSGRRQSLRREEDAQQIQVLQTANVALKHQLEEAHEAARAQGQQLLDQFVSDARFMAGQRQAADLSMELMATPARDVLVETLEEQRKHLESERDKFTEAALDLGREKAALEAERLQFLEEKRAFMVQSILDDLPPTPEAPSRSNPVQAEPAPNAASEPTVSSKSSKPSKPSQSTLKPPSTASATRPPVETTAIPSKPIALTTSSAALRPTPPTAPALNLEKRTLGASTTPPLSEDDLSPTSPTDQRMDAVPTPSTSQPSDIKPRNQSTSTLPPHLRTQTTPVRPTFPHGRVQHKYSPAVPSPLSRVVRVVESPPSSPESKAQAQKGAQVKRSTKGSRRPPVIAEEDEDAEQVEDNAPMVEQEQGQDMPVVETVVVVDTVDTPPPPADGVEPRPGSLSPLSRILHMGLSPAIAPTLAISSFPGLLGTGSLAQNLRGQPNPLSKGLGFGSMPGGFQLGTAITGRVQSSTVTAGGGIRMVAKTVKTVKPSTASKTKPPKVVFGENRPRSSKESTSSSGSGSGESSSGTSSKRAAGVVKPRVPAGSGLTGKENETRRKAAAATGGQNGVKIAPVRGTTVPGAAAKPPPKLATAPAAASRKPGFASGAAAKSTTGKGWKG